MVKNDKQECGKCEGCGQIANDDEGTPWKYWLEIPVKSAGAILMGLVKPITCPECKGKSKL